jgi:aminoglycoside 6'-N-acetyltransferase
MNPEQAGAAGDGPIEGQRLSLRPVEERDLVLIQRWLAEPEVLYWWDTQLEDIDAVREEFLEPDRHQPLWRYLIEEGGRSVGFVQWAHAYFDPEYAHTASIDIFIGEPDARDRGLGTEAVRTLLAYLFEVRGVHRVTIDPETRNGRAIRSYQKAGFRLDGVLRHNDFMRGGYVDTQMMSILETEWPDAKARWARERE